MKIDLLQPFINAADAVLAQTLACHAQVTDVSMEPDAYHPQGLAAVVSLKGDIEGKIVFDLAPETAARVAQGISGTETTDVHEMVCELANQVIGNAVTSLNDRGFHFRVQPPEVCTGAAGSRITEDTESLVMRFDIPVGPVFMNIALRFPRRREVA